MRSVKGKDVYGSRAQSGVQVRQLVNLRELGGLTTKREDKNLAYQNKRCGLYSYNTPSSSVVDAGISMDIIFFCFIGFCIFMCLFVHFLFIYLFRTLMGVNIYRLSRQMTVEENKYNFFLSWLDVQKSDFYSI